MSDDLLERLDRGVLHCGLHDDNETELFEVDDANDTMAEAKAEIEKLREALKHQGGPLCMARYHPTAECTCGVSAALGETK